jgi:hypothetical protein
LPGDQLFDQLLAGGMSNDDALFEAFTDLPMPNAAEPPNDAASVEQVMRTNRFSVQLSAR